MDFRMKTSFSVYGEADDKKISEIIPEECKIALNDYVDFLKKHNGGKPENTEFSFVENDTDSNSVLSFFLGIHDGPKEFTIQGTLSVYKNRLARDLLPIGKDAFGNIICISLKKNDLGNIYFWDHESETDDSNDFTSLHWISSNFGNFFQSLEPAYNDIEQKDEIEAIIEEHNLDALKEMIKNGLPPDYRTKRGAPIADIAAYKGYRDMVTFLCAKGCNLIGVLDSSIRGKHEDIALDIIELMGNDVIAEFNNRTWLFLAAEYNCSRVAERLIELGIDIN